MNKYTGLDKLAVGESGIVRQISGDAGMVRRLLDIGLTEGARVSCVMESPLGDPKAYVIRGAVTAIRRADGRGIGVEKCGGGEGWKE